MTMREVVAGIADLALSSIQYFNPLQAHLFDACKLGNVQRVKHLIENRNAQIEQRAMYETDGVFHFVTPLWCATVAGKLSVVQCLVELGANINSVSDTATGCTAVRVACFFSHYGIVNYLVENNADILTPSFSGGTCLINSIQLPKLCELLIDHGADVNAQDRNGRSALHHAIGGHYNTTVKLLLTNNADPFLKSIHGDDALQSASLTCNTTVLLYLFKRYNYSAEDKANAYELMGSSFFEKNNVNKAIMYWKRAVRFRFGNNSNTISKTLRESPYAPNVFEFTTNEELENLSGNRKATIIQSILVCERILGPLHPEFIRRILYNATNRTNIHEYQLAIKLWRYGLHSRIQNDGLFSMHVCVAAQAVVEMFLDFYQKHQIGIVHEQIDFNDVFESIHMLMCHVENSIQLLNIKPVFKNQQDIFDIILQVLTYEIYVLYIIPKNIKQVNMMKQLICDLLRLEPRTSNGDTLLHLVVSKSNTLSIPQPGPFPDAAIAQLMLECGANVEAINYNLSTPLHIAALLSNFSPVVIKLLLQHGAHIDRQNGNGDYPHIMLQSIDGCHINHLQYINLKCLAARKVVEKGISFIGQVPVSLENFIRMH